MVTHRSRTEWSGKPLSKTPGAEAERLAKVILGSTELRGIKTDNIQLEMISQRTLRRSLLSGDASLVAGNVTGGGGKATRKTT